jgi:hypothetical protein
MRRRLASVLLFACLVGCESPTEIDVQVTTDIACSSVSGTSITTGTLGEIEGIPPASTTMNCKNGHIGSLVIVPSGSDDALVGFKVVTSINGASIDACTPDATGGYGPSCIVARRALRYLPHTPLTIEVTMAGACAGKACDPQSTCVEGACVPATIGDPSDCEGEGCGEGVLVPDGGTSDAGDAMVAGEGGMDATIPDGSVSDGSMDASFDAPSDAILEVGPPDEAGYVGPVPGCDVSGAQAGAAWPMEDYCPSHRNRSPYVGPAAMPTMRWSVPIGGYLDSPSIGADGTVYVGGSGVEALQPSDGGLLWAYSVDGDAGMFVTTPALGFDDTVRATDLLGNKLVVLRMSDGSVVSSMPLTYQAGTGYGVRGGMTLVANGTMFASDNMADVLEFDTGGNISFRGSGLSNDYTIPSVGADGTIFTTTRSIFSTASDGGLDWQVDTDASNYLTSASIAVDGTLRAASPSDGTVFALAADGGTLWTVNGTRQEAAPTAIAVGDDGTTYMGGEDGIIALRAADGAVAATYANGPCTQPVIDAAGYLYAYCAEQLVRLDSSLTMTWAISVPKQGSQIPNDSPIIGPGYTIYLGFDTEPPDYSIPDVVMAFGP